MAITATVVLGPRVFTPGASTEGPQEIVVAAGSYGPAPGAGDEARSRSGDLSLTLAPTPSLVLPDQPPTTVAPETSADEKPQATSTTEAPEPTTTTTEAPEPTTTTTEAPPPSTTTTQAPPPPPPPPPSEPAPAALSAEHSDGVHEGNVSWYDLPGSRAGVCAHRTIDRGTVVTVTNLDTGASITCTVDDRGPYSGDNKVLDLHRDDFSRLAPLEQGVFPARIDW